MPGEGNLAELDRLADVGRDGLQEVANPHTGDRTKVAFHDPGIPRVEIARDEAKYSTSVRFEPILIPPFDIQQLAALVGCLCPSHVETERLSVLEQYGLFGTQLPGNSLLLVEYRGVTCDCVVRSHCLPEPFLRLGPIGCPTPRSHQGERG